MKVVVADDDAALLTRLSKAITGIECNGNVEVCGEAYNGAELIDIVESQSPVDLIITDIRMPVMDGLSALVYLKKKYQALKIVLLSSESVKKLRAETGEVDLEDAKKMGLLEKIAARIRSGDTDNGKINSMLEGCEKLAMDPIAVAEHFGAVGFVSKPITVAKMTQLLEELKSATSFVYIGI
ncbi:MAG: response regulator [Pseudomonadales bacterium]